jgi:glucose-1-phosphate cytidylyltransferase
LKAVILAGGFGTRISEETTVKPKPMIEIGEQPILWHIMKSYSHYGINDFVICCGYKSLFIKQFFANYTLSKSDVTYSIIDSGITIHRNDAEAWTVTCVETGGNTMTGGRLKRVAHHLDETFFMTYGDGVSDIDINKLLQFHKEEGRLATLTAVQPPGRFGAFTLGQNQSQISSFHEKPKGDGAWINGGYFVLEPEVLDYIDDDNSVWEQEPLERIAKNGQLSAYKHTGFWQPMDTLRDKKHLENLWETNSAPWKVW